MGEDESSPLTGQGGESRLYLTDVSLAHTNYEAIGVHEPLNIAELVILGMGNTPEGKRVPLVKASERQWKVDGCIELPTRSNGISIIAKSEEDQDVGSVHLDFFNGTQTVANHLEQGHMKKMETCNEQMDLTISWGIFVLPLESTMGVEDLSTALFKHGTTLLNLFESTGRIPVINEATRTLQEAVRLAPTSHQDLPSKLNTLGMSWGYRFQCTGDLSNITEAISAGQRAVKLTPAGNPDLASRLSNLAMSFCQRFTRTNDLSDIAEAISVTQRAVQIIPDNHPSLPGILHSLGTSFLCRFERTGNVPDLTEAISAGQRAVDLTPASHPDLPGRLVNLGNGFFQSFKRTAELSDIAEAISAGQKAAKLAPAGHPLLPTIFSNLGNSFSWRFDCTGDLSDIAEAISQAQKAVMLTPPGHPNLPNRLHNLGNSLSRRFECTGDLSNITEAISAIQRAVELTPASHPDLPERLNSLGNSLHARFRQTGDPSDMAEAISASQRAVELTPADHPLLPGRLNNLGNSFLYCFNQTSDLSDLTQAISASKRAVILTPVTHLHLPKMLNSLGLLFLRSFEHTGDLSDISEAILAAQKAVKLTPVGHPSLSDGLNTLGISLLHRFQHTSDLSDIAEAISACQKAVNLTPESHPDFLSRLTHLGISYRSRFEHTGDLPDIDESVSSGQRAVNLTPTGHPDLAGRLNSLGTSFCCRFESTGDLLDITEAVSAAQKAVKLTPPGDLYLPRRLISLGRSFFHRFKSTNDLGDITDAISAAQKAVQLTPAGHPHLLSMFSTLGRLFFFRFEHTSDPSDIAEAISAGQKAVKLSPPGHPDLPVLHFNLGNALFRHSVDNLDASISHYMSAATSNFGPPSHRLIAAKCWAELLYDQCPKSPQTFAAFSTAIGLVSLVAGLEKTVQRRHAQLQDTSGLPLLAAAAACVLERADKAVEWLEQGRCLVWAQLNNLRTPLDKLCMQNKDLAQQMSDVSRQLENASSRQGLLHINMSISEQISVEDEARAHLGLAKKWDQLLNTVRSTIPGFENFLQPSPCSTLLQHLPDSGHVVIINVHETRCDALLLMAGWDEPHHIPLPNFSLKKANVYCHDLTAHLRSHQLRMQAVESGGSDTEDASEQLGRTIRPGTLGRSHRKNVVQSILKGLWIDLVKPILDALGLSRVESSSKAMLPRIWWCPTGPLSFLPLHAAGIYRDHDSETILDYAVSSYTPTITSLTDRVRNNCMVDDKVSGWFLTSQPNAPGALSIPGTKKEIEAIHKLAVKIGVRVLAQEGSQVTIDESLKHMQDYSSVHLACHASQNPTEPLQSRFLFHNGSLDLATIIQQNLKNADLAFLSACQTSTGEEKLPEEAVHLAAGMLAAGYRRVVATMWAIEDQHAPQVASDFYTYLWSHQQEKSGGFDGTHSAYALHHAIQQLRQRLDNSQQSFLAWIPYVHFGF